MKNSSLLPSLPLVALLMRVSVLGAALVAIATTGLAASITYNVNLQLNGCCGGPPSGSVTGFIVTDGTIGTLSSANIVDWSLVVSETGEPNQFLLGPEEPGYTISQS